MIYFNDFNYRTKAVWKTITKLDKENNKLVKEQIKEGVYDYISENKYTFELSSIYIFNYEEECDFDCEGYVVRISDHWNSVGKCDWQTDNEDTLIIEVAGKKMQVRFCKITDFELVEWEAERQRYIEYVCDVM